jgi:hypothetical protein
MAAREAEYVLELTQRDFAAALAERTRGSRRVRSRDRGTRCHSLCEARWYGLRG